MPEGYKKTKVGLVPEEWEIKKLSDISDEIKEVAGTGKYETLSISAGIGFVNQANKFGKELSGKQYEKYTVLRKGDFAYNKGNSKKYPQGCVYRLKDRDSAAVPNVFECFRIKEGNKNYIEQVFISGFLNRQLSKKINHGVRDDGLLNLTGEDFYKSYIIIPPLPEQEKIAEILQTQDKVIELQQKKIDELKRLKKGYLSKMFPKKGCNVPEIRFPGFTDAWEQRKLGEIGSVSMCRRIFKEQTSETGDIPFYKIGTFGAEPDAFISRELFEEYKSKYPYPKKGDILISASGSIGRTVEFAGNNEYFQDSNIVWLSHDERLSNSFLKCFYSVVKWAGIEGSTIKRLYNDNILNTVICMPSVPEQEHIGLFFENLDNLITLHQRKCDEEKQKKKALMQLLLTGIVRT